MRKIETAHDAWWFLHEHPAFRLRHRNELPESKDPDAAELAGYIITRDADGTCWREYRHLYRYAIEENLSIFYTMVDETGTINRDPTKNTKVECWLEFGTLEYDYSAPWSTKTELMHFHDPDLDCGAPTFDEALVKLATLAQEHYGDSAELSPEELRKSECGQPTCKDCEEVHAMDFLPKFNKTEADMTDH